MNKERIVIHTDGGSRGNPGPAACAFVAEKDGKVVGQGSSFLGNSTNNLAEYRGVLLALHWLFKNFKKIEPSEVFFILDSELVVRQLSGVYKVKDEKLKALYSEANDLIKKLNLKFVFKSVPREENKVADFLLNKKLDENVKN